MLLKYVVHYLVDELLHIGRQLKSLWFGDGFKGYIYNDHVM
jgi:hypothetical protein